MVRSVTEIVEREGYLWGDDVTEVYFEPAERTLDAHWTALIGPLLADLTYPVALDLASGHGRNAKRLAEKADQVICVDVNPSNIAFLSRRFADDSRYLVRQNDGLSLPFCGNASIDLFYCFDAMVHFDLEIVQSYVREAARILREGTHAFIHCSNYTGNPGGNFQDNPHWRNFMSLELFTHLARKAGFTILAGKPIAWGNIPDLDCVFLLRKEEAV
jgi:SAM-dependent methyltransferase